MILVKCEKVLDELRVTVLLLYQHLKLKMIVDTLKTDLITDIQMYTQIHRQTDR